MIDHPRRVFYDWEFLDDGRTVEPISIGLVDDQGRSLYLINRDMPLHAIRKHDWLMANVVPHLPITRAGSDVMYLDPTHPAVVPEGVLAARVRDFIVGRGLPLNRPAELWGYFPAYDHVCLAQLWGPMSQLPAGVPMRTFDVGQWFVQLGEPDGVKPKEPADAHHPSVDAHWTWHFWEACASYVRTHSATLAIRIAAFGRDFPNLPDAGAELDGIQDEIARLAGLR